MVEERVEFLKGILEDKKAVDLKVIDIRGKSDIADFLIICTGMSDTHCSTLIDELLFRAKRAGMKVFGEDSRDSRDWKVVDFGDVIVHVFKREARAYYRLEEVWESEEPAEVLERRPEVVGSTPSWDDLIDASEIYRRVMARRRGR